MAAPAPSTAGHPAPRRRPASPAPRSRGQPLPTHAQPALGCCNEVAGREATAASIHLCVLCSASSASRDVREQAGGAPAGGGGARGSGTAAAGRAYEGPAQDSTDPQRPRPPRPAASPRCHLGIMSSTVDFASISAFRYASSHLHSPSLFHSTSSSSFVLQLPA